MSKILITSDGKVLLNNGKALSGTIPGGGAYNAISVDNGDGTQTLQIIDAISGTTEITSNGLHAIAGYTSVNVDVPNINVVLEFLDDDE